MRTGRISKKYKCDEIIFWITHATFKLNSKIIIIGIQLDSYSTMSKVLIKFN